MENTPNGQLGHRLTRQQTQTPSQSAKPQSMLPAMASSLTRLTPALSRLSACKNQVALTPFAIETWVAALSIYSTEAVNEAVVRIAMSDDPFPDLGKLVMRCEAIRRRDAKIVVTNDDKKLSDKSIKAIAEAMGLGF